MIYKPTDLSPSAQTFDVRDTPIFFECKVDTSNVRADGYTIKVLNSENDVVFSSIPDGETLNIDYITRIADLEEYVDNNFQKYTAGYSLLNTGYNGSYLKIPFSVALAEAATNSVKRSQIFYSATQPIGALPSGSGLYKYNADGTTLVPVKIYNGQEYKWSITLYQLEKLNGEWVLPKNPLYYDMPLTTGIILGSNDIRIQSIVTDEIYQDYYVQPVFINGLKYDPNKPEAWTSSWEGSASWDTIINANSSNRVLIKTYDPTYGFIYPVTGDSGFAADTIIPEKANGIRIYKRGNNSENLTAYQQVLYVCNQQLDSDPSSWTWVPVQSNPSNSYALQTYHSDTDPAGVYNVPGINISLQGNERIVLNNLTYEAAYRGTQYLGSPHNGIFYPQFMVQKNSDTSYDITVTWRRTPDADSWGELITKNVTVTSPSSERYYGENIQIKDINENTDAYGTINETPFLFVSEKPEELFKNYYPVYDMNSSYEAGSIVRYAKTGNAYSLWNNSSSYTPGTIVYTLKNDNAYPRYYWICVKSTVAGSKPSDTNKDWASYEGQSYYIAKQSIPKYNPGDSTSYYSPLLDGGAVRSLYWSENPNLGTTSVIFYNNKLGEIDPISSTGSTDGRLYIRHFDGLSEGMMLFKNSTTNKQEYVKIESLNSKYNFVTYNKLYTFDTYKSYTSSTESNPNPTISSTDTEWIPANSIGQGTKYQIKSFFRESDESAFYFYSTPTIGIHYSNAEGVDFVEGRIVSGIYDSTKEYRKDEIVEYNNENDFLLWDSSYKYSYGDKVIYSGIHYISLKNNNVGKTPATPSSYWLNVNNAVVDGNNQSIFPTIKYIALTNVGVNIPPSSKNIGIYWEQYIGTLLPSEGFVESTIYNPTKIYEADPNSNNNPIVLNDGLYYYVKQKNESITNYDGFINETTANENTEYIWEKERTFIDPNSFTYLDGYKAWGPYTSSEDLGDPGYYYKYFAANDSWSLYDGSSEPGNPYYFEHGEAIKNSTPYTDFDKAQIYVKGQTVFCEGLKYRVITETSAHLLRNTDYFERVDEHKPFTYPKKNVNANSYEFVMGDIVLGEGSYYTSAAGKIPVAPDRYYVKINGSSDSSVGTDVYKPDDSSNGNWKIYYGPLYRDDNTSSYDYNNIIYDKNNELYFVKLNIQNIVVNSVPLSDYPPVKEASNGVFNGGETYNEGDIVSYRGQFYICKQTNQGVRPSSNSTYWTLYPWQIFIPQITERTLVVNAQYDQQQYIQWKSAQWFLLDETGNDIIDQSDVFYDGDLSYTFHGLTGRNAGEDKNKYFIVRLIIETYNGYRLTVDEFIETVFSVEEISSSGLISVSFDCDTTAVVATITKESGFIIPTETSGSQVSYENGDTGNNVGYMSLDGEIDYEKVVASIENPASIINSKDITSTAERFILQSRHNIETTKFSGNIIGLFSNNNTSNIGAFNVYLEEMLSTDNSKYAQSIDDVLKKKEIIVINQNKDKLMWRFSDSGGQSQLTDGAMHILKEDDGSSIDSNGNISQNKLEDKSIYNYITIPAIQNKSFNPYLYNRSNYLPLTYENVNLTGDSDDPFVDDKYFNIAIKYDENNKNVLYSITSSEVSRSLLTDKIIKKISSPIISKDSYTSDDTGLADYDVKFNTVVFDPADTETSSDDALMTSSGETFVLRGRTSSHWNDYTFIVSASVSVGRAYSISSNDVDYYTQKNVGTQYGWLWSDSSGGGEMWSDGDYITTNQGYNSCLGFTSHNGRIGTSIYFNGNTKFNPDYSNTFFDVQKELDDILIERAYLKNYGIALDLDLAMDPDGYISPTTYGQNDDILKTAAYIFNKNTNN